MPESPLSITAQNYTWRELARRAGCVVDPGDAQGFAQLNLPVYYAPPPPPGAVRQPALYIVPAASADWEGLLSLPDGRLDWLPQADVLPSGIQSSLTEKIPILFWGEGRNHRQPFAEIREDGSLVVYADLLAASFFMLSRWEETVTQQRDEFGRFLGTQSTAYKQGFFDRPIVDEYGLILRAWLQVLFPSWQPQVGRFSVELSHDIDHFQLSLYQRLRLFAGDLLHRHDPALALHTLSYVLIRPWVNPYYDGLHRLVDLSRRYGFHSTFFFMAADTGQLDEGYDISSPSIREELNQIQALGFHVGLHPGFRTFEESQKVAVQKGRLEKQTGRPVTRVRQHYLRIAVPRTWQIWEENGFLLDSSLGYSDLEGFRAGTCWTYPLFDLDHDRVMGVQEQPLIIMEGTLRYQRNLPVSTAFERILEIARRCRMVEGTFTLLWHNSSLWHQYRAWAGLYQRILPELKSLETGS